MKVAMKAMNVIEHFFYPWKEIFIKDLFKSQDSWVGKRPPFALWIKFLWQTGIRLSHNARLALLNYDSLSEIQEQTSYFRDQRIKEHDEHDKKMLKKSSLHFLPHETFQIRIINSQNIDFNGPIFHGKVSQSSSKEELRKLIRDMCFKARQMGLVIEEVEIAHTHPSLETLIIEKGDHRFIFNGLSKTDIKTGHFLSEFIHYPLRIKAITPAVSYSKLF